MNAEPLTTNNVVTIVGWLVTFALGLISALLIQRRTRTRKVLKWTLVHQSDLFARDVLSDLESGFGVPVKVLVSGKEESELSTIRIRLANAGNVELENLTLSFRCGTAARVYVGRYIGNLGLYREKLKLSKQENSATLRIAHINPQQKFELEFLVGKYRPDEFSVDMAEPGVTLKRESAEETVERVAKLVERVPLIAAIVALFTTLLGLLIQGPLTSYVRHLLPEISR